LFVGGLVELAGAIFPQSVRVDGSEDVGHVAGQGCYCSDVLVLPFWATHILFVMHINDYYYNTILTLSPSPTYIYESLNPDSSAFHLVFVPPTGIRLSAKSLNYNETIQRKSEDKEKYQSKTSWIHDSSTAKNDQKVQDQKNKRGKCSTIARDERAQIKIKGVAEKKTQE
jgi:hypothetical protein